MTTSETIIYHNPRCSKSRETLQLLQDQGITPQIRLYLEQTPSVAELQSTLQQLGFASARELMRQKEREYAELSLDTEHDEQALLQALVAHPKLIERPIVIHQGRGKIGRPPEAVLTLFS